MKTTTKACLAEIAANAIFGFSFLFSKVALESLTPSVLVAVRFAVAFLALNLLLALGKARLDLKGKPVKWLLLMGLVQPVAYFICETNGIALTTASFSGIIIGLIPVAGLVAGALVLKEKCTSFQVVCTLLSVVGVAMTTSGGLGTVSVPGFVLLMGAVLSATAFSLMSRKTSEFFSPFEKTYVMFALGSVVFALMALGESRGDLASIAVQLADPGIWISILYLAVGSSVCAFLLVNYALSHLPASRAAIFSNFTTVISVLAGIFLLGDEFTPVQLAGIAIITASVFGVSWQKTPTEE